MRALGLAGLSVTMPHKAAVADHLVGRERRRRLSDTARRAPSTAWWPTTVAWSGTTPTGPASWRRCAPTPAFDPAGRRVRRAGRRAGRPGRVMLALAEAGAAEVVVVNRTAEPGRPTAAALAGSAGRSRGRRRPTWPTVGLGRPGRQRHLGGHGRRRSVPFDPGLLGCTPASWWPTSCTSPVDTPLLARPRPARSGASCSDGLGMLVHQAAVAFERWTGPNGPRARGSDGCTSRRAALPPAR